VKKASHKRTDTVGFHLSEVPRVLRITEAESRVVGAQSWCQTGETAKGGDRCEALEMDGGRFHNVECV
jgi:hypothetical protein